jgi:signal transduction histidine kinase
LADIFELFIRQKNLKVTIENESEELNKILMIRMNNQGVVMDKEVYAQILYNIFQNACKFNLQDGFISIFLNLECRTPDCSHFGNNCKLLRLVTKVQDSGVGIDNSQKPTLFKVFEKVNLLETFSDFTSMQNSPIANKISNQK